MKISEYIDNKIFIIGPCALEDSEQIAPVIDLANKWKIKYFRSQLFKPRTSPHSFQGLGSKGISLIEEIKDHNLFPVMEATSHEQLTTVGKFASIVQIGARNMQNFELLKSIGLQYSSFQNSPLIMLKRGFSNKLSEWLSSAEYLSKFGVPNDKIILCERGSRNLLSPKEVVLDFPLAFKAKKESQLKVIIDPSHGTGESQYVLNLARMIIHSDFDGMMIEVHPKPNESLSDPQQAIKPEEIESFFISLEQ